MVFGDFNEILKLIQTNNQYITTNGMKNIKTHQTNYIDHFYMLDRKNISRMGVLETYLFDHYPILIGCDSKN